MARPERNNVDYFPHPVSHGKGMYYLDTKYGNDGYVVWFRTLERLGKTDFHYLDLRDEKEVMYMSSKCRVTEEKYIEIIRVLVKFGEFNETLWEVHQILWNQKFVDSIQDAYRKRSNSCINMIQIIDKLSLKNGSENSSKTITPVETLITPVETLITPVETTKNPENSGRNPQSKVKDSKVKDSKVKDSKVKDSKEENRGVVPSGPTVSKEFYSNEFKKAKGHLLTQKYYHTVEYIYNLKPNIINEPGTHILKLKKQISFEQFVKLHDFVAKRPTASIISMIDSWLNNPKYSKDRVSVYAVLHNWAKREPIQGTNHTAGQTPSEPILKTSIGQKQ